MRTDTLCIDTCGPSLLIALGQGSDLCGVHFEQMATGQAEAIIPALEALLSQHANAQTVLSKIAVTVGPGSFTGLRVGLSVAKARALVEGCGLVPINRLQMLAMAAQIANKRAAPVSVAVDARRGEHFVQRFDADCAPQEAPATLANAALESWLASGPADRQCVSSQTSFTPPVLAKAMLALAQKAQVLSHRDIRPLYVRMPDAKRPKASRFTLA